MKKIIFLLATGLLASNAYSFDATECLIASNSHRESRSIPVSFQSGGLLKVSMTSYDNDSISMHVVEGTYTPSVLIEDIKRLAKEWDREFIGCNTKSYTK